MFNDLCVKNAEVFFDRWNSLESLNGSIAKMTFDEVDKFFGVGGIFKKAIIMKLCNDSYKEYIELLISELEQDIKEYPDEEVNVNFLNAAKDIESKLDGLG